MIILDTVEKIKQYNEKYKKNQLNGIYLYKIYMNNCYYCRIIRDEWSKFLKDIDSQINVIEIERQFLPEIINPQINKVSLYPTILILKNNLNPKLFKEERTAVGFNNFVKKYINENTLTGGRMKLIIKKTKNKKKKQKNKKKKQKTKKKKQKIKHNI
jgi:large-conductance mechanosensitive channel